MTYYPKIGSVSEGTLRTEDLLDTFAAELSYHMKRIRLTREQRKRFNALLRHTARADRRDFDLPANAAMIDALQDALSEIAAPYSYFGTTEGDGACFGFWPHDLDDTDLPRISGSVPHEAWGCEVLLVNDHGNVECGYVDKRGKFHEYWSCV